MRFPLPALVSLGFALLTGGVNAADNAFNQGCSAYASGNYESAAAYFRDSASNAFSDAAWHNLGNAEWQCQHPGQAILAWERALWINPYSANTKTNLRYARRLAQLSAPELAWWEVCSTWLPINAWAWIAGGSLWLAVALVMLPGIFHWRKTDWHQALAATGFALFLLTIPALIGVHTRTKLGIVLAKDTPLRLTPTQEAQTLTRLTAGETGRVEAVRGSYLYIRTGGDAAGWVRRDQFGLIAADEDPDKLKR